MPEDNRYKFSNFEEVFGELKSVHKVKRSISLTITVLSALLFVLIFGVITYIASDDILTLPFCVLLPLAMFCFVFWHLFSTKNDQLKIYQNGFTYKNTKTLQACLWDEIKSYERTDLRNRQPKEIEQAIFPLDSIRKTNGEIIDFTNGLEGTTEIERRFKDFQDKN
jgi:hypothetical protein